jgi:rubredoxin-NAD+ reductase
VALIGGGLIGCEFANDLLTGGHRVHVIDPAPYPIATLLPEAAGRRVQDALAKAGVEWHLGTSAILIDADGDGFRLTLADGSPLQADLVLSAVGLRPRIALAQAAGIDVGRGIRVNEHLATSADGIYALGDCAEYPQGPLPYVQPIMVAARALAATLTGTPTAPQWPLMPVIIKTPAHPIAVLPPPRELPGKWYTSADTAAGVDLRFFDAEKKLRGFVLSGDLASTRAALVKQVAEAP